MAKNYYRILGITKYASDEAVRRAYRKLALKFHPDKNRSSSAAGRFREIAEAYEVLGDRQKRKMYDRHGEVGRSSSASEREDNTSFTFEFHGDPYATFAEFFGTENPFGLFFGSCDFPMTVFDEDGIFVNLGESGPSCGMRQVQADPPIVQDLEVSLEEVYRGCTKNVEISRMLPDDNGILRKEQKVVPISVLPGWKSGTKITFEKAGDRTPGKIPADFVIVIRDKPHPQFKRENSDLIYTAKLSLKQALCGTVIEVPTLQGETITLNTKNETIQPNTIKRITGNGLPNPKHSSAFGDLLVVFEIKFPELPMKTKEKLFRLLPN